MQVGTFARNIEQIEFALQHQPDFIDLRMDLGHTIEFSVATKMINDVGAAITLHLPSDPNWNPTDLAKEIVPYIDLGQMINAELITFHTQLSTLFYTDEDIENFLNQIPIICDAIQECGSTIAIETLGLYYTELALMVDAHPRMMLALDIGHGQIMAIRNRALSHIESFYDRIQMINVHDNMGHTMVEDIVKLKKEREVSVEEMRSMAKDYDTHLPIGEGSINFQPIFKELKERNYDSKVLMMAKDNSIFPTEREKFNKLWLDA
ncbi:MAG: sugar phosphate isomerase/epimerase family protein [Candidatus Thorarchaeota archaeon]